MERRDESRRIGTRTRGFGYKLYTRNTSWIHYAVGSRRVKRTVQSGWDLVRSLDAYATTLESWGIVRQVEVLIFIKYRYSTTAGNIYWSSSILRRSSENVLCAGAPLSYRI